jgi:glycosyltransferase involved in cell wall biosynthesis
MKMLFIEACNYVDFPIGGQLSFAKQILNAFGDELYLVGIATDDSPVGEWIKKDINGITYNYFALHTAKKIVKKPLIPRRFSTYYHLRKYKREILQLRFDYSMCCAPEVLVAIKDWGLPNLTYNFSGVENPLHVSRYWYGKLIKSIYAPTFYPALKKADYILAAADKENIDKVTKNSNGILDDRQIISFPTRINMDIFRYMDKSEVRKELNLPPDVCIVTTTGRLHSLKGWKLMLEAFKEFLKVKPDSYFYFLGDGDSRNDIESYVNTEMLTDRVRLPGFLPLHTLAKFLNASDLYVMGSFPNGEGWSTALLEAKGCCVPMCTSNFSSAKDIINQGVDGYVVNDREPTKVADYMLKAIALHIDPLVQEKLMRQYSASHLKDDLYKIWNLQERQEI